MEDPIEIRIEDTDGNVVPFTYTIAASKIPRPDNPLLAVQQWTFRIMSVDEVSADFYQFTIRQVDEKTGKVTMVNRNGIAYYSGKRIGDRMIEEAATVLDLDIISSTNDPLFKTFEDESINAKANRIWERLVARGIASRDVEGGIFRYTRQPQQV